MKAAERKRYGPPSNLQVVDRNVPVPRDNEILIKVYAATVNRTDCAILTGKPFIMRLFTGLIKPGNPVTGTDFAGIIASVGKKVKKFKPGDKVWGFNDNGISSHAEYMAIGEDEPILRIPEGIPFKDAAASGEAAHYAYNFLNKVDIKPGNNVLVNGATGAIGSASVQFLKHHGVSVTATASTKKLELVKNLGADKVIDYTKEDFTKYHEKYDFVFDSVGKRTFGQCKPILKPSGVYISSELGPGAENPFLALLTSKSKGKRVIFPIPVNIKRSMEYTKDLLEKGKFKPVIDREYPLEKISEAFEYVASGQKTGNVVIQIFE